ncbi:PilN domain-containing protein [Yersinia aldovae]|uniref:Type IV pilus biogenesis protein PilN n=2 Tax=Yersinia aldovae TaxID=29483 RepID=A0A0T9T1N3_YERAL|nr:PilN domain-containing protein [Yersinia aldovae]CNJ63802.1 type IV pilus biogenesis protein PilN [Yersinia aldovae]CNK56331.1 type IV pilus biogenesis protein PilN [Yersinia aldovae]CNK56362.1 type IV pilus biogenesis protein PilN [Yersinia aldovae]
MYQVNFIPWRAERQRARFRFWRNTGLCHLGLVVIGFVVMSMQLRGERILLQGNLVVLSQQQAVLSQRHQVIQQEIARLAEMKQRFQLYQQARQPARHYFRLLQHLSEHIPDSCWLEALIPQGNILAFTVISRDYIAIDTFLRMLYRQPLLEKVRLEGITQRDDGNFRFVVRANWQPGSGVK